MNVYVSNISVPRTARNKRIYAGYVTQKGSSSQSLPAKAVIEFSSTATPMVEDYTEYETFTQFPTVELYEVYMDEGGQTKRRKRTEQPEFILNQVTLLIESVNFGTLDSPISGFITISR